MRNCFRSPQSKTIDIKFSQQTFHNSLKFKFKRFYLVLIIMNSLPPHPSQGQLPPTNPNDLKNALEYQIDIVLRLEEERLQLIKENRTQRYS